MKKVFRDIALILFVLLAVGVAGFLFYKYVLKRNENKVNIVTLALEKKEDTLISKINTVNQYLISDGNDDRLSDIVTTIDKLDSAFIILGDYFVKNQVIDDANIKTIVNKMDADIKLFNDMYDEYNVKKDDTRFPRHYGANDIFATLSDYIFNYSKLILKLNKKVETVGINTTLEVKFALIDIYANVCLNSYSNFNDLNYKSNYDIKDYENLRYVKSKIIFSAGDVSGLMVSKYSKTALQFCSSYSVCDTEKFAKELVATLDSVNDSNYSESNENTAGYLLLQLLGR